jgi:hypothetical protein
LFVKATRPILIHLLPYLKKIGFKIIIVDPAPGYHPNTEKITDDKKRLDGLIKLYESMGLHRINCYYVTTAYSSMGQYGEADIDIRNQIGKNNLDYDHPVMIGSIDDMLDKMKWARIPIVSTILGFFNADIRETNEFMNVPFKFSSDVFSSDVEPPDYLTEEKFNEIKSIGITLEGGSNYYKQKYLKYKQKYLELKNNS